MGVSISAGEDYEALEKRARKLMRQLDMRRLWQLEQLMYKFQQDLLSFCLKNERDTMCHTCHHSRGASIACVEELLKEIISEFRLSERTKSSPLLRSILPS